MSSIVNETGQDILKKRLEDLQRILDSTMVSIRDLEKSLAFQNEYASIVKESMHIVKKANNLIEKMKELSQSQ